MSNANPNYTSLIMVAVFFAIFYFLLVRPQKKREKEMKELRDSLAVGDKIVTIGGIKGKIVKVSDNNVTIETGTNKTEIVMEKWGISNRISDDKK